MLFNATFNNITVISWRSVLLVEETRVPGGKYEISSMLSHILNFQFSHLNFYFRFSNFGSGFLKFSLWFLPTNMYSSPPLIRSLPPKATSLSWPDFRCTEIVKNTTKLSSTKETTPLTRPLFHCRGGGLIRRDLL